MPKTKFQDLVFSAIMVLTMVYAMTVYNTALESGLSYTTFILALRRMWVEAAIAFIVQRYIARPVISKMMQHMFPGGEGSMRFRIIVTAGCNVMIMAPIMTLCISALHCGISWDLPLLWLPKLLINFPFALIIQVFYIGPFVRKLFRLLFKKQLALV